ncbi:hypothetical protein KAI04_01855 [Candidatus Pacearchaeota archaeon]|nr:hypothetical protein [Candidatus Pacearchaeota archaeon]
MQPTQQPVQTKPAIVQTQQKPVVTQPIQPGQVPTIKKKPTRWWIWLIIAIFVIGGGVLAYFQFLI